MAYGRIPGTFGGGANTPDKSPEVNFSEPENPVAGISTTTVPLNIPGTYEDGAAVPTHKRDSPFHMGYFGASDEDTSSGAGEEPTSRHVNGVCLDLWNYGVK